MVFGHGYRARVDTYAALLDRIAAAGFVVAAPELPGSSSALPGTPNERDLQQEPCDLRFVADQLQHGSSSDPAVAGSVGSGPVALAGQSDGATAAAFAARARLDCPAPAIGAVVAYSAQPVPAAAIDPSAGLDPGPAGGDRHRRRGQPTRQHRGAGGPMAVAGLAGHQPGRGTPRPRHHLAAGRRHRRAGDRRADRHHRRAARGPLAARRPLAGPRAGGRARVSFSSGPRP